MVLSRAARTEANRHPPVTLLSLPATIELRVTRSGTSRISKPKTRVHAVVEDADDARVRELHQRVLAPALGRRLAVRGRRAVARPEVHDQVRLAARIDHERTRGMATQHDLDLGRLLQA
jgi:hypothetical protein